MTEILAVLLSHPEWLLGGAAAAWLWQGQAKRIAAKGMLGRFAWLARIPLVGVAVAAALVVLLANRRTRRPTITVLLCLAAAAFLALCWLAPGLAARIALPVVVGGGVLALWPGDQGLLWRWLDGAAPTPTNIRAALDRDRQRRILAEAVRRSAGPGLPVASVDPIVDGRATVRVAVPAGQSPHALDHAADTITNAVNVLAAERGADLHAVGARVAHGPDGLAVIVDTTPRRLPQRVDWPGAQQ